MRSTVVLMGVVKQRPYIIFCVSQAVAFDVWKVVAKKDIQAKVKPITKGFSMCLWQRGHPLLRKKPAAHR